VEDKSASVMVAERTDSESPQHPAKATRQLPRRAGRWVWRFFTSVRINLINILILAGLSLIGTLLIQVSPEVAADPGSYAWWLENVVRPKLGIFTTPLARLGLLDVFHSPWFLGAGSLLMLSIIVCSINRWKELRSSMVGGQVRAAEGFYEGGTNRAQFTQLDMTPKEAGETAHRVLLKKGYRVRTEEAAQGFYIAADKNRHFRLGTYLHHLSVVLLILGYVMGSYLGFRYQSFMVPEGSVREVGYGTNLSLKVNSFVDEYWPEGPPKDYRSEVTLYKNGTEVQQGLVRVNHALQYGGVRFYQAFFGPAVVMQVRDQTGKTVYDDGVALGWLSGQKPYQRPTGEIKLPDNSVTAYVAAPAQGYSDPLLNAGQIMVEVYRGGSGISTSSVLEMGVPKTVGGLEFTFVRERQFSGFQVARDPGGPIIWIASTLFVLGLILVFYFPHRQAWARASSGPDGKTRLVVRTTSAKNFAVASDFEAVAQDIEKDLAYHNK